MKTARFICAVATVIFTSFSAIAAEQPADEIPLRFAAVSDVYDSIRQQLGRDASNSVVLMDMRTNTLKIDATHPDSAKVRELVEQMDRRLQKLVLAATVKRITPGREEILSRPRIIAAPGQPMILSIPDGANGVIKVEIVVTPEAK